MNGQTLYFYGKQADNSDESYKRTMRAFAAHESLHSIHTSSLPLAQFWFPKNIDTGNGNLSSISEKLRVVLQTSCERCFEYATKLPQGCQGKGKSSMTDLMLLSDKYRVAIEAKFTEYIKDPDYGQTVCEWLECNEDNRDNRKAVLEGWLSYVEEVMGNEWKVKWEEVKGVPYQLLHRIASACAISGSQKPVVVYHLFYEEGKKSRKRKFDKERAYDFAQRLKEWVSGMSLDKVSFYVMITPLRLSELAYVAEENGQLNNLFVQMAEGKKYCEFMPSTVVECEVVN